MTRKFIVLLLICVIFPYVLCVDAQNSYAEIFDPKQNKVVKAVQMNPEIHAMVSGWIANIDGIYSRLNPVTDDGYAVKIPLEPAVDVHSKWISAAVSEVYIIIPEADPPFYLIFDDGKKATCYPFNGDVNMLSKALGFKLSAKP